MGYTQTYTAGLITEEEDPLPISLFTPNQVFHLYDVNWFFVTNSENIETVDDISSDHSVSPGPQGDPVQERPWTMHSASSAKIMSVGVSNLPRKQAQ